jgi:hypothetical protein
MEQVMKKLFETDINEDFRSAIVSQYCLMILTFIMSLVIRSHEKTILNFGFVIEFIVLVLLFKFYFQAQRFRNYAYWGITGLIAGYLLKNMLHFTFIDHDIFVLYLAFLSFVFLGINTYIMSSPLFYPRVQWWEYDFRFRGDLKSIIKFNDNNFEARLTDLRRGAACFEAFDYIPLNSKITFEIHYKDKIYIIDGVIKTNKLIVTGRPIRYGVKFSSLQEEDKNTYDELKRIWSENKKFKLRNKFSEISKNESK